MLKQALTSSANSNTTLQVNPLPNPYPVPRTPFSIRYINSPRHSLQRLEVEKCIRNSRAWISRHIQKQGNGPLPITKEEWEGPAIQVWGDYNKIVFDVTIKAVPVAQPPTWKDSFAILNAMALIASQGGFHDNGGSILLTQTGQAIGTTLLGNERDPYRHFTQSTIPIFLLSTASRFQVSRFLILKSAFAMVGTKLSSILNSMVGWDKYRSHYFFAGAALSSRFVGSLLTEGSRTLTPCVYLRSAWPHSSGTGITRAQELCSGGLHCKALPNGRS